jgi:hypothetical protein
MIEVLIAQDVAVGELCNSADRHAVAAAQIAAVGDGKPQIVDVPAVGVNKLH